jgi:transposase InsO family protein
MGGQNSRIACCFPDSAGAPHTSWTVFSNAQSPLIACGHNHRKYLEIDTRKSCQSEKFSFCVSALEEALARFGRPEIFNTDQGSQFTSAAFTDTLAATGVRISMDGRCRWMDNVFIERLWRSLKYEDIYLKGYADGREAHAGIASWVAFYNVTRPHQALGDRTPMAVWC